MKSLRVKVAVGVLIAGVIVLLAFALSAKRVPTAAPVNISLRFSGFSTNAATNVLAIFSMSNSTPWTLNYATGLPQAKTNGSWSPIQFNSGAMKIIRAGENINFVVSAPETRDVWRVPVYFSREQSYPERVLVRARTKLATMTGNIQLYPGPLPGFTNFTSEIRSE